MTTSLDPSRPDPPTLRVRGPGDLVQLVPYLLGFHPSQSLVVVGLSAGRVTVTARLDLDDVIACPVLAETVAAMHRGGAVELVGIVFDDRAAVPVKGELPWQGLADQLDVAARAAGATVTDVLLVAGARHWSYTCTDPRCCPREGRPLAEASSTVAAAATYAGLVALPDRAAVAALLDPLPDPDRERLLPAIEAAENAAVQAVLDGQAARHERAAKRGLFAAARAADAAPPLGDDEIARFGVALSTPAVRDPVWLAVDHGRLDGRSLWRQLARALPDPYAAAPLFLFGWASWRDGDGALAGIAADRTLASDPCFRPADMLTAALSCGMDPRQVPRLRRSA